MGEKKREQTSTRLKVDQMIKTAATRPLIQTPTNLPPGGQRRQVRCVTASSSIRSFSSISHKERRCHTVFFERVLFFFLSFFLSEIIETVSSCYSYLHSPGSHILKIRALCLTQLTEWVTAISSLLFHSFISLFRFCLSFLCDSVIVFRIELSLFNSE